jgi:hypothetical protein
MVLPCSGINAWTEPSNTAGAIAANMAPHRGRSPSLYKASAGSRLSCIITKLHHYIVERFSSSVRDLSWATRNLHSHVFVGRLHMLNASGRIAFVHCILRRL